MSRDWFFIGEASVAQFSPHMVFVAELSLMDEELRWYQLQELDREDLPEHLPVAD